MKTMLDRLLTWATFLVVFLIPILYFGKSWYVPYTSSKVFFLYAVVEIICVIWMYLILTDKSYRLSKKIFVFLFPSTFLILWLTISCIFSPSPSIAFWSSVERGTGLITWYHLFAFSVVVVSLVQRNNSDYINKLIFWFLNSTFVVALSVWLGDEGFNLAYEFLKKSKGGGLIGNSSLAAAYLLFGIFFALFFIFHKEVRLNIKIWAMFVFVVIVTSPLFLNLYSLFLVGGWFVSARAAMVGAVVGVMVSGLVYAFLSQDRWIKTISILILVLGINIFVFGWFQLDKNGSVINQKFIQLAGQNRLIFWDIAAKGIAERPVFGWGLENYAVVYQKYFNPKILTDAGLVEVWNDRAHNVFFDIGVAGGWLAIVLYFCIIFIILYGIHGAYFLGNISRAQAGILSGLVVAYVLQNLFVFDSVLSLLGFFTLIGLVFGLNQIGSVSHGKLILENKNIIITLLIVLLGLCIFFFTYSPVRKVWTFSEVISMSLNKRPDHYVDLLSGSRIGDAWEVGKIVQDVYTVYSKNKENLRKDPKLLPFVQRDFEKMLEYIEVIAKKEPTEYILKLNLVRLYNLFVYFKKDEVKLAPHILEVAEEAQALSPQDPQIYWAMSQTYVYMNNLVGAEMSLRRSVEVAPNFSWSHKFLINFAKDTNNQELYRETVLNAKKLIPNFVVD